jgi:tight adherence protein B
MNAGKRSGPAERPAARREAVYSAVPAGEGKSGRPVYRWLDWLGLSFPERRAAGKDRGGEALPDYGEYHLSAGRFLLLALAGCALAFAGAYLFYRSVALSLLFAPAGMLFPRFRRRSLQAGRQERLRLQFKEALFSLTSSLAAGRSVENAFFAATEDLALLYPDPHTDIRREFAAICHRFENGEPLESALRHFADRARIDEISHFADVFTTCKRVGGDLVEVIKRTSQLIGDKLEVQQEIAVMLARKRFESRVMMAVPFVFLAFLGFAAPDYMEPLYGGFGYVLLTAGLAVILACCWAMIRIMSIRL